MVRPASPGSGDPLLGGLGLPPAVISPGRTQALRRSITEFIKLKGRSPDFRALSTVDKNKIIKAFVAALTKGALGDAQIDLGPLDHLEDAANQTVPGQEGYTLQWTDTEWDCFHPESNEIGYVPSATDIRTCTSWQGVTNPMSAVSNAEWKLHVRMRISVFKGGSAFQGFLKTGTPGEDFKLRPLPVRAFGRNKITRTITALNPHGQMPGKWTESKQIPEKLMGLADALADLTEPFAEARSRDDSGPIGQFSPQTNIDFSAGRGKPKTVETKLKFPEPFKGKEVKNIGGIAKGSLLGKLLRGVTESLDFLNVAYEALPRSIRPMRRTSQLQRIELVITNIASIDLDTLIEGLIANEIEDRFIGSLGGAAARATAKATGKPIAGFTGTGVGAARRSGGSFPKF